MRTFGMLLATALLGGCTTNNLEACSCPEVNDPVCAASGVTYASGCWAECAGERIASGGFCSVDGGACACTQQGSPVCGSDKRTWPNACAANCAGVGVLHPGACESPDLGTGNGGACHGDSDCTWRDSGCCGLCWNRTDPVAPPLPCGAACFEPPPCLCQMGKCAAGSLPENAKCDPNRDQCAAGLKCCATCCGVPPPPGMSWDPDPRCVPAMLTPQGPMCAPLA